MQSFRSDQCLIGSGSKTYKICKEAKSPNELSIHAEGYLPMAKIRKKRHLLTDAI